MSFPVLFKSVKMAWILKTYEKLSYMGQIVSPLAFLSSINLRFQIHTGRAIAPQHASVYIETRCILPEISKRYQILGNSALYSNFFLV